jgi:hypothetical protein
MPIQLRIYTINRGALDDFAAAWKKTIKPLREKLGFTIPAAWTLPSTNQFVWLMQYEGSKSWEDLDQAYFSHPDRLAMSPDPARHIARMEAYFMDPVT